MNRDKWPRITIISLSYRVTEIVEMCTHACFKNDRLSVIGRNGSLIDRLKRIVAFSKESHSAWQSHRCGKLQWRFLPRRTLRESRSGCEVWLSFLFFFSLLCGATIAHRESRNVCGIIAPQCGRLKREKWRVSRVCMLFNANLPSAREEEEEKFSTRCLTIMTVI